MGFLDSVFGRKTPPPSADELAVARYEQVLRTADPEDLERVHTEAFEKLTPEQRDLMFEQLLERATAEDERPADASPASLGKTATLVEVRKPGTLKEILQGPDATRLWTEPNQTFYIAFASYFLGTQLAFTLWGTDAGDTGSPDAGGGEGFGGGFDGGGGWGDGGGFGGGDGGGAGGF